jgi:hypothetical protein
MAPVVSSAPAPAPAPRLFVCGRVITWLLLFFLLLLLFLVYPPPFSFAFVTSAAATKPPFTNRRRRRRRRLYRRRSPDVCNFWLGGDSAVVIPREALSYRPPANCPALSRRSCRAWSLFSLSSALALSVLPRRHPTTSSSSSIEPLLPHSSSSSELECASDRRDGADAVMKGGIANRKHWADNYARCRLRKDRP